MSSMIQRYIQNTSKNQVTFRYLIEGRGFESRRAQQYPWETERERKIETDRQTDRQSDRDRERDLATTGLKPGTAGWKEFVQPPHAVKHFWLCLGKQQWCIFSLRNGILLLHNRYSLLKCFINPHYHIYSGTGIVKYSVGFFLVNKLITFDLRPTFSLKRTSTAQVQFDSMWNNSELSFGFIKNQLESFWGLLHEQLL